MDGRPWEADTVLMRVPLRFATAGRGVRRRTKSPVGRSHSPKE